MNMVIQENYKKWLEVTEDPEMKSQLMLMTPPEIDDAFYRELEFGTGGLRGIMGAGTNRMNIYTVNKATQGLCDYLKSQKKFGAVAIAYDSRKNSEHFAKSAAEVIAGNGGKAYVFAELMPTPVLSYAVRKLKCDAGIVITASHNPAAYNGYKVYGNDGCQITDQAAGAVQSFINDVEIFSGVKSKSFGRAMDEGAVSYISPNLLEEYLDAAGQCAVHPGILSDSDLKVIYTPLNGTGKKPVREILTRNGLENLSLVPEQENPDCLFSTCKVPNPEETSAFLMAIRLAEKIPADLLLATDPDCDRVGVAVKRKDGYSLLTGNETGCLLLNFILSQKKIRNLLPENPVIIKTIVTSAMADMIAGEYGAAVIDTLTGFKYIGEQIGVLEQKREESRYVFGFEESYGYLPEIFVRDKDAVSTALLICEMAAFYKNNGSTLFEELEKLYEKYGFWKHRLLSFSFAGADGMKKIDDIMLNFRRGVFREYAGLTVGKTDDYLNSVTVNGETGENGRLFLPKSNVMVFSLGNHCEIVIRPSGNGTKTEMLSDSHVR